MTKQLCNKCGNEFDMFDEQENFGLHYHVGYGSVYDSKIINLDLCCKCFDELIDYISPQCKYDPIKSNR